MGDFLENRPIENQTLEDSEVIITDEYNNFFGPDLTLKRCRVILRTRSRRFHILKNVQAIECQITAKKNLVNFSWLTAEVLKCKFTGRYTGNEFGHWPEYGVFTQNGSIEECDFSEAHLDGCRFTGCNMRSLELPRWPFFTLLDPHNCRDQFEAVKWPEKLRFWAESMPNNPSFTSGVVYYAPALAKGFGCTVDDIRECLTHLSCVIR